MLVALLLGGLSMVSCSDDDDNKNEVVLDAGKAVAGIYSGEMGVMGYTDLERGFVTITRMASDAVKVKVQCEDLDMNLNEIIMDVTVEKNVYKLNSNGKAVTGSIISGVLTMTFNVGSYTFTFTGKK